MPRSNRLVVGAFALLLLLYGLDTPARCQSQTVPQLYFFTNAACGPCRQVEPELEQLHREGFSVMKIDTFAHPEYTQHFQVSRTPTVILVADGKVVARRTGFVDAATMRQWFRNVAPRPDQTPAGFESPAVPGAKFVETTNPRPNVPSVRPPSVRPPSVRPASTRHVGTPHPANEVERLAMQATVRLKVDDPRGSSYATGTVVHYHAGEALVVTCGHVFRDSGGRGIISAEYGFAEGHIQKTQGELLFYDADARDIGLVAIATNREIRPVPVATESYPIHPGDQIFSIGCDHGEAPTIRRSRVKNQARYDGVTKYEIFGRPVDGRSGGGMFTAGGQLVGVCNAAVVDADEGVYVALDTIHWQFRQYNVAHLFNGAATVNASQPPAGDQQARTAVTPRQPSVRRDMASIPVRDRLAGSLPPTPGSQIDSHRVVPASVNSPPNSSELIVVLRSRDTSAVSRTWTVQNPSRELIEKLQQLGRSPQSASPQSASPYDRMARLRQSMSESPRNSSPPGRDQTIRAQSPH